MSEQNPQNEDSKPAFKRSKMSKLDRKTHKVTKRALIHTPPPSPYASADQQKTVYVNSKTPVISAVKRVKSLLDQAEKRRVQATKDKAKKKKPDSLLRNRPGVGRDEILETATELVEASQARDKEEVLVTASGKAIEKLMHIGLFLQEQCGFKIRIHTNSVRAVDDVEVVEPEAEGEDRAKEPEVDEVRIRWVSVLEIYVSQK